MINTKYYFFILLCVALATSCADDEDFTGYSTQTATSGATISVEGIDAGGYSLVETDVTYTFPVKLSQPQITDVVLYVSQTDGDATEGSDFTYTSNVIIPALSTEGVLEVTILSDDILEGLETFTLQVGDDQTSNATVTPVEVKFEILNATGNDLGISMSWDTDASSAIGIDLDPTDAIDLRLLIIDAEGEFYAVADGGSFEASMILGDAPDGDYKIATDIYSTIDAGDFDSPLTIDLFLEFNQPGSINGMTLDFPSAMSNDFPCDLYRTCLATITKSGSDYQIARDYSLQDAPPVTEYVPGVWAGSDSYYILSGATTVLPSHIEVTDSGLIYGLNVEWMTGFWSEEILVEGEVSLTVTNGVVDIPSQYIFTTLYDGAEYSYTVSGTGTISQTCEGNMMIIEYTLDQDGFDPSGWAYANGYQNEPVFTAEIAL